MKTGRDIVDIARELKRQMETKKDYVVDTKILSMTDDGMLGGQHHRYGLTNYAHSQLASRLSIPKNYYDRLRTNYPALLAENVNAILHQEPEKRMIRTLDGHIRAFVSDRYRPLDNYDLAEVTLPSLEKAGCELVSAEITETRMYLKAVTPRLKGEVTKGDPVQAGIVISNSEVGAGSLRIEPLVYRLVCLNGMIATDHAMRKYHVGRRSDTEQMNMRFFRDETRSMTDRAFWMQVRDTVAGVLTEDGFETILTSVRGLKDFQLDAQKTDPQKMIEDVTKRIGMSDTEKSGVLQHLIEGGDLSGYGVMNAVTRMSQDVDDYDRATELERVGGMMTGWSVAEWKTVGMVRS